MTLGAAHPLDVDLADLVDGVVDETRTAELEAHLARCLLCRIKRRRIEEAPPAPLDGDDLLLPGPAFPMPSVDDAAAEPTTGDLWIAGAGEDEWLLVLVLRALGDRPAWPERNDRVLVAPVTFDIEAADDETLIIDDHAVYPALATELPRSLLRHRTGSCDLSGARAGGPPITGSTDPRLEVRQFLADRLGSMETQPPDPASAADAPAPSAAQLRSVLVADVRDMRGDTCAIRPLYDWGDALLATQAGWDPVATIDEVGIVLVVFDTPHGLADDTDFNAARSVLTRFNATAVVVLAARVSDLADVFDSPSLNYGIDAPSGAHTPPRPLISGLTPCDAIGKFLDQTTGARFASPPVRPPVARVDVGEILGEAAADALADALRQASRFKIAPKRRGYESVAGAEERFRNALGRAFDAEAGAVPQALIDLARDRGDPS